MDKEKKKKRDKEICTLLSLKLKSGCQRSYGLTGNLIYPSM